MDGNIQREIQKFLTTLFMGEGPGVELTKQRYQRVRNKLTIGTEETELNTPCFIKMKSEKLVKIWANCTKKKKDGVLK